MDFLHLILTGIPNTEFRNYATMMKAHNALMHFELDNVFNNVAVIHDITIKILYK